MINLDDFDIDSITVKLNNDNDNDNPMATNIVICSDFVVNRYCGAQPLTIIDVPNKQTSIVVAIVAAVIVVVVVVLLGDMLLHRHFKEVEVALLLLLFLSLTML
jgi:purine-cytosine permease-like protein